LGLLNDVGQIRIQQRYDLATGGAVAAAIGGLPGAREHRRAGAAVGESIEDRHADIAATADIEGNSRIEAPGRTAVNSFVAGAGEDRWGGVGNRYTLAARIAVAGLVGATPSPREDSRTRAAVRRCIQESHGKVAGIAEIGGQRRIEVPGGAAGYSFVG